LLLKESWLSVTDNTNVRWVKVFQLYKGSTKKSLKIGFFLKGSARIVEPPRLEYKGFKYKFNLKGDICRLLFVRANFTKLNLDGSSTRFYNNSGINIRKKQDPKSKFLNGPITRNIKRKKFLTLFKVVI